MPLTRTLLLVVLALAASLGIPVWLGGGAIFAQIGRVAPGVLAGAPLLMLLAWSVNALRVQYLLGTNRCRIRYARAWLIAAGGDFGAALGPGLLTGVGTYVLLGTRIGLASHRAMALFTLEKLLDLLIFFATLMVSLGLLLWVAPRAVPWYLLGGATALCAALLAAIVLGLEGARWALRAVAEVMLRLGATRCSRRRWLRWGLAFRRDVRRVARQPPRQLLVLLGLAGGYWSCRFAILPLLAKGLGLPIPWPFLVLVQVLTLFAGQLSLLPGGALSVELVFTLLLAPWADGRMLGTLLLLWRASVFYLTLSGGGLACSLALGRRQTQGEHPPSTCA